MTIKKDVATTILGGIAAAGTAVQPMANTINGDMKTNDIVQLIVSVAMALWAWYTNKGSVSGDKVGVSGTAY